MRFFKDDIQRSGLLGYIGGLATALAIWGVGVDGWMGKAMQIVAALVITIVLLMANGMLGGPD